MIRLARYIALLLLCACALCAGVAEGQAQSLDTESIPEQADTRLIPLVKAGVGLRDTGRNDILQVNQQFAAGAVVFPERLPSLSPEASKLLWSLFFRKTQVVFGADTSPTPIVGYYNPLVDCWLLTKWKLIGEAETLVEVRLVNGSRLGTGTGAAPRWAQHLDKDDPVPAIQMSATSAIAEFLHRFPANSTRSLELPASSDIDSFVLRVSAIFESLSWLKHDPKASSAVSETLQAIAEGDTIRLLRQFEAPTRADVADLVKIPEVYRSNLEISLVQPAEGGALIWASRPEDGRWLFVAGYALEGDGHFKLTRLTYIDLLQGPTR